MNELLKFLVCIEKKPIRMACMNQQCKVSPFVCSQNCVCFWQHQSKCQIKSIEELSQNMMRVLQFQFLVMYSPILKGSSVSVMGRYAEQTMPRTRNQQFALTFDPISKKNTINQIYFRLTKIKSCVGVGVFIKQTMLKNCFKYMTDEKYMNHGGYMLLSNNYLFSSSVEEQNCIESQKMNLKEGSVVHVKILKKEKESLIEFKDQSIANRQYLRFNWSNELAYHFGVYLYDEYDSVQILNKKIQF